MEPGVALVKRKARDNRGHRQVGRGTVSLGTRPQEGSGSETRVLVEQSAGCKFY